MITPPCLNCLPQRSLWHLPILAPGCVRPTHQPTAESSGAGASGNIKRACLFRRIPCFILLKQHLFQHTLEFPAQLYLRQ